MAKQSCTCRSTYDNTTELLVALYSCVTRSAALLHQYLCVSGEVDIFILFVPSGIGFKIEMGNHPTSAMSISLSFISQQSQVSTP